MSKRPKLKRRLAGPADRKPSFSTRKPLKLVEIPPKDDMIRDLVNNANGYLRCYTLGECSIIVTRERDHWHLSIAHKTRYPTWDEIAEARYRLLPDTITAALLLPPKKDYVNFHENCFQLHEIERHPETDPNPETLADADLESSRR